MMHILWDSGMHHAGREARVLWLVQVPQKSRVLIPITPKHYVPYEASPAP